MNNPNTQIVAEDVQRNVARLSERDAELVAAVAMAFGDGIKVGEARAQAESK